MPKFCRFCVRNGEHMKSLGGHPGRPPGLDGGYDIDIVTKNVGEKVQ